MWEDNKKFYQLLYGIDVDAEKDLKKKLSEIKEEKISLIELITISMSNLNGKTRDEFLNKDIKTVEIGPGEGIMAKWLSDYVGHVYCFDISETMLDACKKYTSKIIEEKSYPKFDYEQKPENTWESFWKNSFSIPNDINLKEIINKHAFHVNEKTFKT